MKILMATWPDSSISFIPLKKGYSERQLWQDLDNEECPMFAECVVITSDDDGLHITTDLVKQADGSVRLEVWPLFGKMKKFRWTKNAEQA